ncbi:MAG TPA: ABC transporter substrate-binding protein [Actinomycetota bacterium]|nr:ABC transporter substrate-binding protein [Actinomycetota bacterium]
MRRFKVLAPLAIILLVAAACGGDGGEPTEENTGNVNVLNALEPEENAVLQSIADQLINPEVDYTVEFEQSANFEEQLQIRAQGGTLDVILLPQPGAVQTQAASGNAVSLEDMGFDIGELEDTFGEYFLSLGEYEGEHYGIPTNINLKSMVWYPKDDFDAAGYTVPTTWDEMISLSDQIVADGGTPWCVGFESGGATGWPATDWMEDIMLATAGQDVYTQWVNHDIPFNDPAVVHAGELFGDVMFGDGYVLGGAENTPSLAFGDAPAPMFQDPPGCWLHRQASFITAFFPEDAQPGVDYDWFPFPQIDQQGTLFAGELAVVFRNAPEVKDFVERFMAEDVQCAMGSEPGSSRISPNINVGPDCYPNPILAGASEVLTAALGGEGAAGFDASDQMPPEVGSGSFWTGMVEYMQQGPDSLESILGDIDSSWPS